MEASAISLAILMIGCESSDKSETDSSSSEATLCDEGPSNDEAWESNNSLSEATPVECGQEIDATIAGSTNRFNSDTDWYVLELDRKTALSVDVYKYNYCRQVDLYLYDSDRNPLNTDEFVDGTVYIEANAASEDDPDPEYYHLTISCEQCPDTPATTECYEGDLWSYTECGDLIEQVQDCGNEETDCNEGACCDPEARGSSECYDGDAWYNNECGDLLEKKRECGSDDCNEGKCCDPEEPNGNLVCNGDDLWTSSECDTPLEFEEDCGSCGCNSAFDKCEKDVNYYYCNIYAEDEADIYYLNFCTTDGNIEYYDTCPEGTYCHVNWPDQTSVSCVDYYEMTSTQPPFEPSGWEGVQTFSGMNSVLDECTLVPSETTAE